MMKLSATKICCAVFLLCVATATRVPAQTFTTLFDFDGNDGARPYYMTLVQAIDGNYYGTTWSGGAGQSGTLFRITMLGQLSYGAVKGAGNHPEAGLVLATDGNFYGTTSSVDGVGDGGVFKVTPQGRMTMLYLFCSSKPNCADGGYPYAPLIQSSDGNFYGTTTSFGGHGGGTVFKIDARGRLTTLYAFCAQPSCADGNAPYGGVIQASDGNFYGTTQFGGGSTTCGSSDGCGTVFRLTPAGEFSTIHRFEGSDGFFPFAGLVQGIDGNLYGTTTSGGSGGACGTVFKIGPGVFTTLFSFCNGGPNGAVPTAPLIQGTDGKFYGTTSIGGDSQNGTIFSVTAGGALTTLYSFSGTTDGYFPYGGLLQATNGSLYGTTWGSGEIGGMGTVFSLDTGLGPFVAFVQAAAKVGQTGGILGQGFTGTTAVSLNGTPATFTVKSDSFIEATVPPGATTGYVTVTTPSGTLTSNVPFHVIP